MISINNFFGVDLERMPNHISIHKDTSYNSSGELVKKYTHIIPECDNHFFDSLEIIMVGSDATNFIFDPIPYSDDKATDIAFVIERDFFNNGKLNYMDYLKKNGNKLASSYSSITWDIDKGIIDPLNDDLKIDRAMIQLSIDNSEISLKVWSFFHYDMDKREEDKEIPADAKIAEDGIVEYKFGGNLYPQGCEIFPEEKDYVKPLPIEDFTFRTIKIRISATNERLDEAQRLLSDLRDGNDVTFVGAKLNDAFVFVETSKRIVLPMTEFEDRKNLLSGSIVGATIKGFDCDKLDTYIGFTFQIMTSVKKEKTINLPISELFGYRSAPGYLNELIEQYRPTNEIDFLTQNEKKETVNFSDISKAGSKIISISFREYDLPNSNLEYLKNNADNESIEFKLSLKTDKRKRDYIAVESVNSDYPLSTEIKDECFIEDFKNYERLLQEGKASEKCYGVLFHYQDANSEFSTSQRIFFHIKVYMPWMLYKEIPVLPQEEQETPSLEAESGGEQEYISNLVGFKFCLKEDELEEVDKYFYEFENNIYLRPEIDNPFDPNAIAAYLNNGKKIAYVAKENAQVLRPLLKENEEFVAKPERFNFTSAMVRLSIPCNRSLEMVSLFSQYKPIEVYKAHYLNVYWGGSESLIERKIFNTKEQTINFKELLALHIKQQNYLANEWKVNMNKASVDNPTNLGLKMSVHLDLSIYGTNYNVIDLSNIDLLNKIEEDSKKTALFVRLSREGYVSTPNEFIEEYCPNASETLIQRLEYEYKELRSN